MPTPDAAARKRTLLDALRGRSLEDVAADPVLRPLLDQEAASPKSERMVEPEMIRAADASREARRKQAPLGFWTTHDVIIVPGFLGSQLVDNADGGHGLIWVDPKLPVSEGQLNALRLADADDSDADGAVSIGPDGGIPLLYVGLRMALQARRYHVETFGFDWRKDIDFSAEQLAEIIRGRGDHRNRPLHIVAHSQGSLVARRAMQLLGPDLGRQLVRTMVLLGPATAGSFSAAFGISGKHDLLESVRRFGIHPPEGFDKTLASMTGMYQLLPWRTEPANDTPVDPSLNWLRENQDAFKGAAFWNGHVDERRLGEFYEWGRKIDATYFNDRTAIILGDVETTVGGVTQDGDGRLMADPAYNSPGDGTVTDAMARINGVHRVFKATESEHLMLPATWKVIVAVTDLLAERTPRLETFATAKDGTPRLAKTADPEEFFGVVLKKDKTRRLAAEVEPTVKADIRPRIADVSPPPVRRLRAYSFDPLFSTNLENISVDRVTIELPWEFADGGRLGPGPVGEYLEVVDFDASSQCFYPPVDLDHPHLLAQDGLPPSEGDPRFHQQMVYAVAMNSIHEFEVALGRSALWAPNLRRNAHGEVIADKHRQPGDEYVGRLRVYPHAMRQDNAYYSPDQKALLFGYFRAGASDVGRNLPGGTVFSCLSYDIIAHETTHALLDGLHRNFTQPSNPDVLAFHEAFSDLVALLQHFSHADVLKRQIAEARGQLSEARALGVLAAQFGEARGQGGGLRQYLARYDEAKKDWVPIDPNPRALAEAKGPHARGAVLVAAVFRAFVNIYDERVKDLRRIATNGSGILPPGDLHPDMVNRLAGEAAKAAKHLLRMSIRALDYLPPVDPTFGEYLRALVTADYELVRDDDRGYRVSVVSAFRDWGIYPGDVRSLSVDSLLWSPPEEERTAAGATGGNRILANLHRFFETRQATTWKLHGDRREAYAQMKAGNAKFHQWLSEAYEGATPADRDAFARHLGLSLDPDKAAGGLRRKKGRVVFHVDMFRPCRRIGPDGQEVTDFVIEVMQRRKAFFDLDRQKAIDAAKGKDWNEAAYAAAHADFYLRGGSTLVIDAESGVVRYCIRKSVAHDGRLAEERNYRNALAAGGPGAFLDGSHSLNPFAALHADH